MGRVETVASPRIGSKLTLCSLAVHAAVRALDDHHTRRHAETRSAVDAASRDLKSHKEGTREHRAALVTLRAAEEKHTQREKKLADHRRAHASILGHCELPSNFSFALRLTSSRRDEQLPTRCIPIPTQGARTPQSNHIRLELTFPRLSRPVSGLAAAADRAELTSSRGTAHHTSQSPPNTPQSPPSRLPHRPRRKSVHDPVARSAGEIKVPSRLALALTSPLPVDSHDGQTTHNGAHHGHHLLTGLQRELSI